MKRSILFWLLLLTIMTLTVATCGDDDDDDNDDNDTGEVDDDDTADDDTGDDDTAVDAHTSASPERDDSVLDAGHGGWQNADCFACHNDVHLGGFIPGECVTCHGANGAPRRAAGHENGDCTTCHAGSHSGVSFESPKHCTACHKYEEGVECPVTESYDVVVIGAGGGGLGAAAALAKAGLSVALIEKQYKVGGYMTTFHRGDYTFEASLHAMGGFDDSLAPQGTINDFTRLGILDRITPIRCEPMYIASFPGREFAVPANIIEYKNLLKEMYPAEADGIERLFTDIHNMNVVLDAVMNMSNDFNFDDLFVVLGDIGSAVRLIKALILTLDEFIDGYITNTELRGIFTQLVTYIGGAPGELQAMYYLTMWYSYHTGGFYYIEGGSKAVSEAMADVIRENGGVIKLNTLATKIVIEDNLATQVQTLDDACYNARYVVSNANAPDTLLRMVGEEYLPRDYLRHLEHMTIAPPTLQVFLGVDHDYTDLFEGTHELMVNLAYDMNQNFDYVYGGDIENVPIIITNYSASDPSMAPAGKNVISITTYLPHDWEDTWQWYMDYDEYTNFREEVAEIMIERAEQWLPDLGNYVELIEVGSPMTNYAYSLNPQGTILGWANTPRQGTLLRLPQQTPFDNLILAGAWTFPGGGQTAVINSGVSAADMVLAKEAKRKGLW